MFDFSKNIERLSRNFNKNTSSKLSRFYGVVVSTLDFESKDTSSNLGRFCFSLSEKFQCSFFCLFSPENKERSPPKVKQNTSIKFNRIYGVVVSTLDFESKDPSSNLGRTSFSLSQKLPCNFVHVCFL